jgi:hypothetical protein
MEERNITKKMLDKLREGRDRQAREAAEQFVVESVEKENFLTRSKTLMEEAVKNNKKKVLTEAEGDETFPPDMRKKVMRRSFKMQGYRVQVYSGGNSRADRQRAETAGAVMKANFPDQPIYTHFYSPSWKCRMGNYKSQAEAQAYLSRVRKLGYRQACIVKGMIQVQY